MRRVPDNLPVILIYFLLHKYHMNHGLIQCFSNLMEWVDLSRCDLDQHESSQNLFYSNLELSQCDSNLQNFCTQLFQHWIYFYAQHFKIVLAIRFSTRFPVSFFIVSCHGETLMTMSNKSQLIILVPVTCGCGPLMALNGFIPILTSTFCPKSTLILLPLFRLPKGKSRSLCPRLSTYLLTCLSSKMSLSHNCAILIARYFNHIVIAGNERYSILVRLVSVDWSVTKMDICLAGFLPNGVVNDIDS